MPSLLLSLMPLCTGCHHVLSPMFGREYQKNAPRTERRRTFGLVAAVSSCGLLLGYRPLFKSESISQVVFFLLWLLEECPKFRERIATIFYDDMCHMRRYLELRKGEDAMFAWLLDNVVLLVDKMHIRGHKTRDDYDNLLTYCGKYCDPRSRKHAQVYKCGGQTGRAYRRSLALMLRLEPLAVGGCWTKLARV